MLCICYLFFSVLRIWNISICFIHSGASPKIRDPGRHLCAEEWARFCGRHDCADAIAKLSHTRSFFSKPKFRTLREKSCSVPDLSQAEECKPAASDKSSKDDSQHSSNGRTKGIGKAFRKIFHWENESGNGLCTDQSPFAIVARCVSTPLLPEILNFSSSPPLCRRPLSIEHLSAIPKVEVTTPAGVLDQPDYNNTSPARRRRKQTSGGCKHCDVLSKWNQTVLWNVETKPWLCVLLDSIPIASSYLWIDWDWLVWCFLTGLYYTRSRHIVCAFKKFNRFGNYIHCCSFKQDLFVILDCCFYGSYSPFAVQPLVLWVVDFEGGFMRATFETFLEDLNRYWPSGFNVVQTVIEMFLFILWGEIPMPFVWGKCTNIFSMEYFYPRLFRKIKYLCTSNVPLYRSFYTWKKNYATYKEFCH